MFNVFKKPQNTGQILSMDIYLIFKIVEIWFPVSPLNAIS